jgi:regulation of enolase protein 1 (concanavalin A-like superfamily)
MKRILALLATAALLAASPAAPSTMWIGACVNIPASDIPSWNTMNARIGPLRVRRCFNSNLPADFQHSAAAPNPAAGCLSFLSTKADPNLIINDVATQNAITAFAASWPASHLPGWWTMWHEPENDMSGPTFAKMFCAFYKAAKKGNPDLTIGYVAMSYQWGVGRNVPTPDDWFPVDSGGTVCSDFLGVDCYNVPDPAAHPTQWHNFDADPEFQRWYAWSSTKGLPLYVVEHGCMPDPADPNHRANELLANEQYLRDHQFQMFLYWQSTGKDGDWSLPANSPEAEAWREIASRGIASSPPATPTGLHATIVSSSRIDLGWTDASTNETGFKIERKTGSGGTYAQTATPAANATSYSDTGLAAATPYFYRIRSYNSAGNSAYSGEISATTSASTAVVASIMVSPSSATVGQGGTQTFTATAKDASGTVLNPQPTFNWSVSGGGTISASGTFTAGTTSGGPFSVQASSSGKAGSASLTVTGGSTGSVAPPWVSGDVGAVVLAGTADELAGNFTVTGAGNDIWGTADAFHFVHQPWSGDVAIVARVTSLGNTNPWAKAGVMIRGSLDPSAPQASLLLTSANGVAFQRRTSAGQSSVSTAGGTASPPQWVRLVRSGDTVTGSVSADGVAWTDVGSDTIPMAAALEVGMVVTSHDTTQLCQATFDAVGIGVPSAIAGIGGSGSGGEGSGGGGGGGGGCGLTGLELMILPLLRRISGRRRPAA